MRRLLCGKVLPLFGALVLVGLSHSAAPALNEFQKLAANDGLANDNFGFSVGISGDTAILGAWKDDRPGMNGTDAGSAYLFDHNGAGIWSPAGKLVASDSHAGDSFGSSVAISGDTAIVGAVLRDNKGGAYIFQDNGAGVWEEIDILSASDAAAGDEFGYSVAIGGDTAIVGAWTDNLSTGAAYVFRDDGSGAWTETGRLTASDGVAGDRFGVSVAISGTTALVGAHFESNEAGPLTGAVYVFENDGTAWNEVDKLIASDASLSNQFGSSIAISGDTAIIGAMGDNTSGVASGAAYIFQREAAGWREVVKLTASDAAENDLFGFSVGIDATTAVVGAYQDDDAGLTSGSAYFFTDNGSGNWSQVAKLSASDNAAGDAFGYSVAISGGVGLVGAPLSNSGDTDAGAGYLFNVPVGLLGDYNSDSRVDAADYVVWRKQFGMAGANLAADGNGDSIVNQGDYQLWRQNFGISETSPPPAALLLVPEPSAAALLLVTMFALSLHRSGAHWQSQAEPVAPAR